MLTFQWYFVTHGQLGDSGHESRHCNKNGKHWILRGLANDVTSDGITAKVVLCGLTNTQNTDTGDSRTDKGSKAGHQTPTGYQTA
jgi:hypothetical protein